MRLVLFDVDGTLLLTGGAGSRALERTFQELYGFTGAMAGIRPDGKTDPEIVREVLRARGLPVPNREQLARTLFPVYVAHLREELQRADRFRVLDGVRSFVEALHRQAGALLGLATGNIEEAARLKVAKAGLAGYFRTGGFGSDGEDRTELIRASIARCAGPGRQPRSVVLIGDTPQDIFHGRRAGARVVAVATGSYSEEELAAHRPDLLLSSLKQLDRFLAFWQALKVEPST